MNSGKNSVLGGGGYRLKMRTRSAEGEIQHAVATSEESEHFHRVPIF